MPAVMGGIGGGGNVAPAPKGGGFLGNLGTSIQHAVNSGGAGISRAAHNPMMPAAIAGQSLMHWLSPPTVAASRGPGRGAAGPYMAAAIHSGGPLESLVKNFSSDAINFIPGTIKGIGALGSAAVSDAIHGRIAAPNSELTKLIEGGVASDPIVKSVTSGSLDPLLQHPGYALLDLSGAGKLIGRGAGAVARATGTGGELAQTTRELVPGVPGTSVIDHASPNLLSQALHTERLREAGRGTANALQNAVNNATHDRVGSGIVPGSAEGQLRRQVALEYGPQKAQIAKEYHDTAKALKDVKPDSVERGVAPYIAAFGGGRETLQALRQQYLAAKELEDVRPSTAKLLDQHISNLESGLAEDSAGKLNWDQVHAAAQDYGLRQQALEQQKVGLGMYAQPELERSLAKQYALQRVPGADFIQGKGFLDPQWVRAARVAASEVTRAKQELRDVQAGHDAAMGVHNGASRALSDVTARLPLNPSTANTVYHIEDLRAALERSRGEQRDTGPQVIAAKQDALKDAQDNLKALKDAREHYRVRGLVIRDESALPIAAGKYKGQQLRPLTTEEVHARMDANGDHPAYVRMNNPERQRPLTMTQLRADNPRRAAATGAEYTGQAAQVGDWTPGWDALLRSQLGDVLRVGTARLEKSFMDRYGVRDEAGQHFTPFNVERAQAALENRTGMKFEKLADQTAGTDKMVLVPKPAVDELRAQLRLEQPQGVGKLMLKANRAFRNTVLPFSPKLPVMHTVENVTRALAAGASPADFLRARAALNEMDPAARARLEELATPGGLGGQQSRLNMEDLGRSALQGDRPAVMRGASQAATAYDNTAQRIIGWQRWLESKAQTAALGVHMRKSLQEWGHSWADANTSVQRYAEELAKGYSNPALAEDAARYIHETMGQYNNFTARQRWIITRMAPFAPWYMNAAKLLLYTLPKNHPLATALVNDVSRANSKQWDAMHTGLPKDMQSYLPVGNGGYLDWAKFTPVGLTKSAPGELGSLLFPQYAGAVHALFGQDPFGNDYKGPNTKFGKSEIPGGIFGTNPWPALARAGEQLGESFAGPLTPIARAVEGGGSTLYNTSYPLFGVAQVKPGTHHFGDHGVLGGLERWLFPFTPTYYTAKSRSSGLGSTRIGSSGLGSTVIR